ncbi:hypothetical protein GW17_00000522 [Ensete ventricosum]|nr:hypothetical protein GW17_00000522 [Ensete ventricosum]
MQFRILDSCSSTDPVHAGIWILGIIAHGVIGNEAIEDGLFLDSFRPAVEHDVNVLLVNEEISHRQHCHHNLGIKCSLDDIFSNKIMRTRFPLFVIVSVVLCLAACIILLHPHEVGEFAVSIRRCMFGGSTA